MSSKACPPKKLQFAALATGHPTAKAGETEGEGSKQRKGEPVEDGKVKTLTGDSREKDEKATEYKDKEASDNSERSADLSQIQSVAMPKAKGGVPQEGLGSNRKGNKQKAKGKDTGKGTQGVAYTGSNMTSTGGKKGRVRLRACGKEWQGM